MVQLPPPPPPTIFTSIQYVPSYFNIKTRTHTHAQHRQLNNMLCSFFFVNCSFFFLSPLSFSTTSHNGQNVPPLPLKTCVFLYTHVFVLPIASLFCSQFLLSFLSLFHLYLSLAIVRAKLFPFKNLRSLVFFFLLLNPVSVSPLRSLVHMHFISSLFLSLLLRKQSWAFPTSFSLSQTKKKNPQRTGWCVWGYRLLVVLEKTIRRSSQ